MRTRTDERARADGRRRRTTPISLGQEAAAVCSQFLYRTTTSTRKRMRTTYASSRGDHAGSALRVACRHRARSPCVHASHARARVLNRSLRTRATRKRPEVNTPLGTDLVSFP
eukprot:scaffold75675_cov62-Phaeocystis_antarctica.AAC.2